MINTGLLKASSVLCPCGHLVSTVQLETKSDPTVIYISMSETLRIQADPKKIHVGYPLTKFQIPADAYNLISRWSGLSLLAL